jgi:hypothetical protein
MDKEDRTGTGEYVGDSPGEPFEMPPDEPVAVDEPGTTAEEQRQRSLERRLAMEEPEVSSRRRSTGSRTSVGPILDDDIAPEDAATEDPDAVVEESDLDRTSEETGELSSDPAESAEEAALHIERE